MVTSYNMSENEMGYRGSKSSETKKMSLAGLLPCGAG